MKLYKRLFLLGGLLLALALVFAACSANTPRPTPVIEEPTDAPTAAPTTAPVGEPVFEIVTLNETRSFTLEELMALPATEGYGGIKSSTGKITPPILFKGVALKDLAEMAGMDETNGLNVVAEDGYSITFSYDQIMNGTFIAYDPIKGDELKKPVELTAMVAYEIDGKALDPKEDGILRLIVISDKLDQVTDGHWAVKWVNKIEIKPLVMEWQLKAVGGIEDAYDRGTIESCSAPQCHGASWTDDKAQEWVGVPLYVLVGGVDDENTHEGIAAYNTDLVEAGYTVDVISSDGYTVTFDAKRLLRNMNIIVAHKVNENPLDEKYFPLRLVGSDLQKNEMAGMITEIKVNVPAVESGTVANVPADQATLAVTGLVDKELTLNEAALRGMEVLKITAEHPKKGTEDYEGVSLKALLELAGVQEDAATLVVTAADGFVVEIGLADVLACENCLFGFTETAEKFKLVLPGMESNFWAKDVVSIEVK
ncbi:MAG: molybdopterin-dependent oxidoreductase [Anaerolineae bacterium]|nr:molybdopterin-dependent oxidoreductase [Anaerolineae bacterium]